MKKTIVIIGVNYYPEDTAIGLYTSQKAEYLAQKGYKVQIITGVPYYPQWEVWDQYKKRNRWTKDVNRGIEIYRYKQYVPQNPSFGKRIAHLLSFTFGSFINLFRVSKPDIIISIVPFTSSVFLGYLLKLRYRSKLWVHIQDFEFDAAIDSGLLSSNKSTIIRQLLFLERVLLKQADVVSTISNSMLSKLKEKNIKNRFYLPNWLDTEKFNETHSRHPYLQSSNFKILYSGNIGKKQDWNFFQLFLKQIKTISDIEIVIVGQGAEKQEVLNATKDFIFVRHFNPVSFTELASLLSSADLHILFQKDDVIDTVMPSKILGMMGSERPSIITGNKKSEVKKIIEESKSGFYFQSNQMKDVVQTVIELKNSPKLCDELGKNAKKFVIQKYSKEIILNDFLCKLKEI